MKSIINSKANKRAVLEAVERALDAMAEQHDANIEQPDAWLAGHELCVDQPTQIRILIDGVFPSGKSLLGCRPVVDVSNEPDASNAGTGILIATLIGGLLAAASKTEQPTARVIVEPSVEAEEQEAAEAVLIP